MLSNVLQVEVRPSDQQVLCNTIAQMFCDFGDVCVKKASERIFWIDFEYFEQEEIDKIKVSGKSKAAKDSNIDNLLKIKTFVLSENK